LSICLFGGTFDPPHLGHLIMAQAVLNQRAVDEIHFVLAANPPHKPKDNLLPFSQRLEMLKIAVDDYQEFKISTLENQRKGKSYSRDTILEYREKYHLGRAELLFLIGSDSLIELDQWKAPQEILRLAQVIVAVRPGFSKHKVNPDFIGQVEFIQAPLVDISSSLIRQHIQEGLSIRFLVPSAVEEYIYQNKLYRK